MLSIGRLLAGDDRERYYLEQVGQGRDDYYAGEGDGGGEWAGTGAPSLGAVGGVTPDGLSALLRGTIPSAVSSCASRRARAALGSEPALTAVLDGIDAIYEIEVSHEANMDVASPPEVQEFWDKHGQLPGFAVGS